MVGILRGEGLFAARFLLGLFREPVRDELGVAIWIRSDFGAQGRPLKIDSDWALRAHGR